MSKQIRVNQEDETFNGWANWETWNVALWISNDEGLYSLAKRARSYRRFVAHIREIGGDDIALKTPDGVAWGDPALDIEALDKMISEG